MARNKVISFRSKEEFLDALKRFAVPRTGWRKTKSQLYGQAADGETTFALRRGKLVRLTWRSQAEVYRRTPDGRLERLYEAERIVNGKKQAPASGPSVSEKLVVFPWPRPEGFVPERHREGIIRCFHEELGITVQPGRLTYLGWYPRYPRSTRSFPIQTIDFVFLYEYEIPYEESKPEYVESRNRKKTTWRWRRSRRKRRTQKARR